MTDVEWQKAYDKAVDELIRLNRDARTHGSYVAFSGPGYIFGQIDPALPYGVIRNGDGRLFDILPPHERAEHPLPAGYCAGQLRAEVVLE